MKGFLAKRVALKADMLKNRKIYCAQARPCIFEPGNVTGLGSEGVKGRTQNHAYAQQCSM